MSTGNPLAGRQILVVEDEAMVVMLIEDMLEEAGCTITPVGSIPKALAIIEDKEFDAALLDLNINGETSYAVADALTARGIPFAFSTGYGESGVRPDYQHIGMVEKPYRSQRLVEALNVALARRPAEQAGEPPDR